MDEPPKASSARRDELLEAAYAFVLAHGLSDLSLRPLAAAIGSSPRVLLFLFDSKDGLVRALLARARADELCLLADAGAGNPAQRTRAVWAWLADPAHRPLLCLWLEVYARSLIEPHGPWSDFAARTVSDWLALLAPDGGAADASATLHLAVLRGALLDLLATGDVERTGAAVEAFLDR
jgi:AcrR family transcriptional regulator